MNYPLVVNNIMFKIETISSIKVAHIQKAENQSIKNGVFVIEMIKNSSNEIKKNFSCLIKPEIF